MSEGAQRKQVARVDLNKIFYNNENNFTLEKYVKNVKGVFNVMEKYSLLVYEDQMVNYLLNQIMSPNT